MITEQDLQEAIAECQGVKNPNANTCIKLAAFYTIREHMFGGKDTSYVIPSYSYAPAPEEPESTYQSDTEFFKAISGMDINAVLALMDELMSTLQAINPRLYAGVMRKIAE